MTFNEQDAVRSVHQLFKYVCDLIKQFEEEKEHRVDDQNLLSMILASLEQMKKINEILRSRRIAMRRCFRENADITQLERLLELLRKSDQDEEIGELKVKITDLIKEITVLQEHIEQSVIPSARKKK